MTILPRQARDKHRESCTEKRERCVFFLQGHWKVHCPELTKGKQAVCALDLLFLLLLSISGTFLSVFSRTTLSV